MERKYQIFISSTYVDLIDERQEVTKQILNNYHFPVGMEMFAPSDEEQWKVIEKTIDSSDIYILLLGYRYGSVLDKGNGAISYTEMEFQYAARKKKPIIVFIKDDTNLAYIVKKLEGLTYDERCTVEVWKSTLKKIYGNNYAINEIDQLKNLKTGPDVLEYVYTHKFDKDQSKIQEFRAKVHDRLIGSFSKDKKIDVQNAITQRIKALPAGGWVQEQSIKKSYLLTPKYIIAALFILMVAATATYWISESASIQSRIVKENGVVFDKTSAANAEFARVLPNDESLEVETATLGERIASAKVTFSMYTQTFKRFVENEYVIRKGVKNGLKFRLLLLDTSKDNYDRINSTSFYDLNPVWEKKKKATSRGNVNNNIDLVTNIIDSIKHKGFKGQIELRFSKQPLYYSMWILDPLTPQGVAHFTVTAFDNFKPNFRVSAKTSRRLFNELDEEFKKAWNDTSNLVLRDSRLIPIKNLKDIEILK